MQSRVNEHMGSHQLALLKLKGRVACSQQLRSTPQQFRSPISCKQSCACEHQKTSKGHFVAYIVGHYCFVQGRWANRAHLMQRLQAPKADLHEGAGGEALQAEAPALC